MQSFLFENVIFLYALLAVLVGVLVVRYILPQQVTYRHALASSIKERGFSCSHPYKKILAGIRFLLLALLSFFIARPQLVDTHSRVHLHGIDIMLVLDLSGSMNLSFGDTFSGNQSRLDIAKKEAVRFIQKRTDDAIGLLIFGKDAVTRCPITSDRSLLRDIVQGLSIGDVDHTDTMLSTAIATAASRLKNSTAESKVMVVLTDGTPGVGDINPDLAIEIAQKLGIKIYTIGIGPDEDEFVMHPVYGPIHSPKINGQLLEHIAHSTGGKSFMAHNTDDMRAIYDSIDQLEKTEWDVPLFSRYYDLFIPFGFVLFMLLALELFLSTYIWFAL